MDRCKILITTDFIRKLQETVLSRKEKDSTVILLFFLLILLWVLDAANVANAMGLVLNVCLLHLKEKRRRRRRNENAPLCVSPLCLSVSVFLSLLSSLFSFAYLDEVDLVLPLARVHSAHVHHVRVRLVLLIAALPKRKCQYRLYIFFFLSSLLFPSFITSTISEAAGS